MKGTRASIPGKVLAWVLCLAGLTAGVVCGGQTLWLANQGAYQTQGSAMLLEQGEEELAQSYLEQAIVAYQAYLSDGISMEQSMDLDRNNAFYTVKDPQGNAILASDELGDYREKATWTGTIQGPRTEESVTRYYDSPTAREQGLEELEKTYDEFVLEEFTDLAPYDEIPTEDEAATESGTAISAQERYLLEGYGVNYGKSETVEIAVYLRANLTPGGEVYTKLTYLSQMGYYRVELAVAAVVGLALGVLGLALLIRGAGYGPKTPEGGGVHPVDRYLPVDLLAVLAAVILLFWNGGMDLGAYATTMIPLEDTLLTLVSLALLAAGLLSALRQKRAETWRENLLWRRIGQPVKQAGRKLWALLGRTAAQLPLFWLAALVFVVLCFFEGLCILAIRSGNGVGLLWLLLKAAEGVVLIWVVLAMRRLQEGAKNLAAGQLAYQLPLKKLWGPFRAHGEDLNNIRQGIQHAVEEQMKSERMKTELITNVSHDIKTPLTSIVNYVDLLKKEPMPNDQAKEYLEVLDRQSARLKKLTEDLVEASKASTGNLTVDLQPTDVNVLLTQTAGEYQEKLAARDLSLVLTPAPEAPKISADGRLLWRVFENLFSNIQKYALAGTRVYLTCQADENEVTITFRNISATPLNISADELMERFVRGDTSRNTEGSGLGLSIARSLTQLQHGTFSLTIDGDLFKAQLRFPRLS